MVAQETRAMRKWQIVRYLNTVNGTPRLTAIADNVGLKSVSQICALIAELEKEGYLERRQSNISRYRKIVVVKQYPKPEDEW
jgi:DNA-binding MarR family transcriptional regulator